MPTPLNSIALTPDFGLTPSVLRRLDTHPRHTRVHTPSGSHRSPSLQREKEVFFSLMLRYVKTLDAITHDAYLDYPHTP